MISIIVPVYNAEKYLHRCVDSVLGQSYTNFELLLIDDGSPDNSGVICDEYAAKDSRVRVFHKENGGVSSARNLGLDNARGEWVTFIDSDDWIEIDYFTNLTFRLDADFIVGSISSTDGKSWIMKDCICSPKSFVEEYIDTPMIRAPWGSLLRLDIIVDNNIRFDPLIRYGEDAIFNMEYLSFCRTLRLLNFQGYNYYQETPISIRKYVLTVEETVYSLRKSLKIKERLNHQFGMNLSYDIDYMVYLGLWPINEMVNDAYLEDYYNLYRRMNSIPDEMTFYNDRLFSPIARGISEMKVCYQNRKYDKWMLLCKSLHFISLNIDYKLKFAYKDFYIWYWLIKKQRYHFLSFLLKIYFSGKAIVYSTIKK